MKKISVDFGNIKKKRQRKKLFIRFGIGILILGLLIFGVVRIVFYSSFLRVQEVIINGDSADKEKVSNLLRDRINKGSFLIRALGFNNFLAWPKSIEGSELASLPGIENLVVSKEYGSKTVAVDIISKKPFAIWCLKKNSPPSCFLFGQNGVIFGKSPEASGNLIQVISDYSQDNLSVGSKILEDEFVPNMISILKVLSEADLSVSEISLKNSTREEIDVQTDSGPVIYFSLRFSAENYLSFIKSLSPASVSFKNIQYIDLRVPNRAYYK